MCSNKLTVKIHLKCITGWNLFPRKAFGPVVRVQCLSHMPSTFPPLAVLNFDVVPATVADRRCITINGLQSAECGV